MPSQERRKYIEKMVDDLMTCYSELKIPAFDLAKFLTEHEDFSIGMQSMEENTTGILLINDDEFVPNTNKHKLIAINSLLRNQPNFSQRRRFIVAHEYGHSILHKANKTQYAHRDTNNKNAPQEKEADYFARCLLMPKHIIEDVLSVKSIQDLLPNDKIMYVSRAFNVTPNKARQRLSEDLHII